jgi:hypothetical protein
MASVFSLSNKSPQKLEIGMDFYVLVFYDNSLTGNISSAVIYVACKLKKKIGIWSPVSRKCIIKL